MAYFGGHTLEITASKVKINGQAKSIQDKQLMAHEENGKEIFQITKFGSYYFVMNLRGQPFQFYTAYGMYNLNSKMKQISTYLVCIHVIFLKIKIFLFRKP